MFQPQLKFSWISWYLGRGTSMYFTKSPAWEGCDEVFWDAAILTVGGEGLVEEFRYEREAQGVSLNAVVEVLFRRRGVWDRCWRNRDRKLKGCKRLTRGVVHHLDWLVWMSMTYDCISSFFSAARTAEDFCLFRRLPKQSWPRAFETFLGMMRGVLLRQLPTFEFFQISKSPLLWALLLSILN